MSSFTSQVLPVLSAALLLSAELRKSISSQEDKVQQLQAAHDQLQQSVETVQELPLKLRHQVGDASSGCTELLLDTQVLNKACT